MTADDMIEVEPILRALDDRPSDEVAFKPDVTSDAAASDDHIDPDAPPDLLGEDIGIALGTAARWRPAKALLALRAQVDAKAPRRSKASDGTIGDTRHCGHANAKSDHCPRVLDGDVAVVCALDLTHDAANGCDAHALAERIRLSRDRRVKYIISNGRIANSKSVDGAEPFGWRPYTGGNPHNKHCHISVHPDASLFDDTTRWRID